MKRVITLLLVVAGLVAVSGCLSRPSTRVDRALDRVAAAERRVEEAEGRVIREARTAVHGTRLALSSDPSPSLQSKVASRFVNQAQVALGVPPAEDAFSVAYTVSGALSPDPRTQREAEESMRVLERRLGAAQNAVTVFENDLERREDARDRVAAEVAVTADFGRRVKRVLWAVAGLAALVVAGPALLRIAGLFFPAAGLLGSFASSAIGGSAKVAERAGVVLRTDYEKLRSAFDDLVTAVQEIRRESSERDKVEQVLFRETDRHLSRPLVEEAKVRLQLKKVT